MEEEGGMIWCKSDVDRLLRMCGIYEPLSATAPPFTPQQDCTKIQQARVAKGLKQIDIAQHLRLKKGVIQKFEAGEQQLPPETYTRLKRLLNVY